MARRREKVRSRRSPEHAAERQTQERVRGRSGCQMTSRLLEGALRVLHAPADVLDPAASAVEQAGVGRDGRQDGRQEGKARTSLVHVRPEEGEEGVEGPDEDGARVAALDGAEDAEVDAQVVLGRRRV